MTIRMTIRNKFNINDHVQLCSGPRTSNEPNSYRITSIRITDDKIGYSIEKWKDRYITYLVNEEEIAEYTTTFKDYLLSIDLDLSKIPEDKELRFWTGGLDHKGKLMTLSYKVNSMYINHERYGDIRAHLSISLSDCFNLPFEDHTKVNE